MFLRKVCLSPSEAGKTFGASARGNEAICQHGFFNGHEEAKQSKGASIPSSTATFKSLSERISSDHVAYKKKMTAAA